MRLHIVGLPWTETTDEFVTCAYTAKIVKAGKMLTAVGHEVIIYSGEENEAICTEHVPLFTRSEREEWFGPHDQNSLWGHITWDPTSKPWRFLNARAISAITDRSEPRDLLLLIAGVAQKTLCDALPHMLPCEPFVGYKGILTDKCAFESHAWRHHIYGLNNIQVGRNYDTVIQNYFDVNDFIYRDTPDDYLLFVGRMNPDKGVGVAAEVAKATGRRILFAGPGVSAVEELANGSTRIVANGIIIEGPNVEYLGILDPEERAQAMANATCLLAPTMYIEPFGGVAVEAMMCGTPVLTSDFGAFTETVQEGISGFRFSTLAEGVRAVELADHLDRSAIRDYAFKRYSLEAVAPLFTHWFENLDTLWEDGWYTLPTREAVTA